MLPSGSLNQAAHAVRLPAAVREASLHWRGQLATSHQALGGDCPSVQGWNPRSPVNSTGPASPSATPIASVTKEVPYKGGRIVSDQFHTIAVSLSALLRRKTQGERLDMSEFDDRVRNSEAVSNLRQSIDILSELESRNWEHYRVVDQIARSTVAGKNVLDRMALVNRGLVTEQTLGELAKPSRRLLNAIQEITGMSLSDEPDYATMNSYIDTLLTNAVPLPDIPIRSTPQVIQRAAEQFHREVTSSTTEVAQNMASIRSEISDARSQMQENLADFQELVAQFEATVNQRFNEAENNTNSSLSQMTATAKALLSQTQDATDRLERNVTSIQEDFRKYEQERANEFVTSQSSRKESQNLRDEEYSQWFEAAQDKIVSQQNEAITMLEQAAGASTAKNYSTEREKQNKDANFWRWIAVLSFGLLVLSTGYIYSDLQSSGAGLSIAAIVSRYGIGIPLIGMATYAMQQSGHHRKREQDMSRVANEMILLWPFINRVPEENRNALLKEIAPKYFKGGLTAQDAGDKMGLFGQGIHFPGRRNGNPPNP